MFSGTQASLAVNTEGVSFDSLSLTQDLRIGRGSATMTKCTFTSDGYHSDTRATLVMEDSRVFGSSDRGAGVYCTGKLTATSCTVEGNATSIYGGSGVFVS